MFTNKDIEFRTIFVINCMEGRAMRVSSGELLIEDTANKRTLTKFPFQKILALFIIGQISITTPLIEKCRQYNVAIIVTKLSLRPVFFFSVAAEANFLLRQRQYQLPDDDLTPAKAIVINKVMNQLALLNKLRGRTSKRLANTKDLCADTIEAIANVKDYDKLLSLEGNVARNFFACYFEKFGWKGRNPRLKSDYINVTLDIGYTILFNYVECFARMFGFDVFVGVYHRLWFKRKSLICDLMEPFRCIIDNTVRNAMARGRIKESDFECVRKQWQLRRDVSVDYYRMFFEALIPFKNDLFRYIREYYRAFMQGKGYEDYPQFKI